MAEVFLLHDYLRINGLDGSFIEDAPEKEALSGGIRLVSVKNQFVSFQICLKPASGRVSDCSISFSALESGKGRIGNENFTLYAEWFHRLGNRLIPDLLLPADGGALKVPMDGKYLSDQKAGAVWVDLWIGKEVRAGNYEGRLAVTADGKTCDFTVRCAVIDEALPDESQITADLNNYADSISPHFDSLKNNPARYRDGSYLKAEQGFYRMSRDHRCVFHNLPYRHSGIMPETFYPELEGEGKYLRVKSWEGFDKHFGPYLDGSAFKGCKNGEHPLEFMYLPFSLMWPANYEKWGQKGYKTEYRRILTEFVRHFEEKGWTHTYFDILLNNKKQYRFSPYTIDEIWYDHDQDVVDTYYDIIKGIYETSPAKFLFRMDSSNHYGNHFDHRFSDYCKMWVAGFGMFNWFPESVPVMNKKGNILWIYGGVLLSLQESLGHIFLWPLQTLMTGASGFCVWNTTGFGDDPLSCPAEEGGMALFYPGSYFGREEPLPSIRLKALRSSMQLAGLICKYKATPLQNRLADCVNKTYGRKGNGDWFMPKPPFLNTAPQHWDFGGSFWQYCLPQLHRDRPYDCTASLTKEIYEIVQGNFSKDGPFEAIRYQ